MALSRSHRQRTRTGPWLRLVTEKAVRGHRYLRLANRPVLQNVWHHVTWCQSVEASHSLPPAKPAITSSTRVENRRRKQATAFQWPSAHSKANATRAVVKSSAKSRQAKSPTSRRARSHARTTQGAKALLSGQRANTAATSVPRVRTGCQHRMRFRWH